MSLPAPSYARPEAPPSPHPRRVFVLGATGTIGRATVRALVQRGHEVVCFVRPRAGVGGALTPDDSAALLAGATLRFGDVTDPASLARDGFRGERFDALVSCLASRTGAPRDAWAIDHQAHVHALAAARQAGVPQMVLLSAICVQKPLLAFQHAKLAFEKALIDSGLTYSIVRPTAFFKSLSGQVERVQRGKPFLRLRRRHADRLQADQRRRPGDYLADCLDDRAATTASCPSAARAPAHHAAPAGRAAVRAARAGRRGSGRCRWRCSTPSSPCWAPPGACCRRWRTRPNSRASAATTPPSRCWCWTPRPAATTPTRRRRTGSTHCFDYYARLLAGTATDDRGDHAVF